MEAMLKKHLMLGVINLAIALVLFLLAYFFYILKDYLTILTEEFLAPLEITLYTFIATGILILTSIFFLKSIVELARVFDHFSGVLARKISKEPENSSRILKDITVVAFLVSLMPFAPAIKYYLFPRWVLFGEILSQGMIVILSILIMTFLYDACKILYKMIERKIEEKLLLKPKES